MSVLNRRNVILAGAIAVGLALVPAISAAAFSDTGDIFKSCGTAPVPYIQVQSTGSGRVNHSLNSTVLNSFNNGATSQSNYSLTTATSGYYRVFLTGSGGNITYGSGVCHS